jgi:hypothetical protein
MSSPFSAPASALAPDAGSRGSRLPRIQVHADGHYLQTADGEPFFWLADTAWELIHHTTREEASYYLHARGQQGFTVIQTVVLAEFNGVSEPSAWGEKPFFDEDPRRPNAAFFDRVADLVEEAAGNGLYVALVVAWGDKLTAPWGAGPRLFRNDNLQDAFGYAKYLATRLKDHTNVLWMLGGDRPPRVKDPETQQVAVKAGFPPDQDWTPIWREMARGIAAGLEQQPLILYHPQGGKQSTSAYLQQESWLSVNGMQSGHGNGHDVPVWEWIERDYALRPARPTLDLEPNYEDHPVSPWPDWDPAKGYFRDLDVRKQVYRSVFAGGCGVTYGHHAVWGFPNARNGTVNHVDRDWIDALHRPAGTQVRYLRELVESRPFFERIPDQSMIAGDAGHGAMHIRATRDRQGTYALAYLPASDLSVTLDLKAFQGKQLRAWWYDPRAGVATLIPSKIEGSAQSTFRSPSYGPDWVLALDDVAAGYPPPGLRPFAMAFRA